MTGENQALPFELGVFKIKNDAYFVPGDSEAIEHLTPFMVRNRIDNFGVNYNRTSCNQAWHICPHYISFVDYLVAWMLNE